MSLKCWSGTFENTLSSWLEVWYLHFDLDMVVGLWYTNIQNWVLIWGFGGRWRFLTGVWYLDLDLEMISGCWHIHDPNFGSLSWFWRCKEHPCPLIPHLGLWRTLEVLSGVWHLDLDLDMVTGVWYTHDLAFGSLSWFWRSKKQPCPLSPHLGLWRMLKVPDLGFTYWDLFHMVFDI